MMTTTAPTVREENLKINFQNFWINYDAKFRSAQGPKLMESWIGLRSRLIFLTSIPSLSFTQRQMSKSCQIDQKDFQFQGKEN